MHVGIHHIINDAQKWDENTQKLMTKVNDGNLPAGMKPVLFIPAVNKKTALCVWEADSVDSVRKFVDGETGSAARNEYFEADTKNSVGLPEVVVGRK
jgi:hypothetical protein